MGDCPLMKVIEVNFPLVYSQRFDSEKIRFMMEATMLRKRQEKLEAKMVRIVIEVAHIDFC